MATSNISAIVYTNSFLATLNARKSFRSAIDDSHAMLSMPQSALSPQASSGGKVQNISIRIEKSTSQDASQKISVRSPTEKELVLR